MPECLSHLGKNGSIGLGSGLGLDGLGLDQPFSTRVLSAFRFLQGHLGKMPKNCPKIVHKSAVDQNYKKLQVFIVHHYDLLDAGALTTNDVTS